MVSSKDGVIPEINVVVEFQTGQSDQMANKWYGLRSKRRLARVMVEHSASAKVGKGGHSDKEEEGDGGISGERHDDYRRIVPGRWMVGIGGRLRTRRTRTKRTYIGLAEATLGPSREAQSTIPGSYPHELTQHAYLGCREYKAATNVQ